MSMIFSLLPLSVFSTDTEGAETAKDTQREVLYSDDTLSVDAGGGVFAETDGSKTITLRRTEELGSEKTYAVLLYDSSANYGADYKLWYGGTVVEKREGATSIYDAFRDNGQEISGLGFDLQMTATNIVEEESGKSVNAADMLSQLDEIGALAAEFSLSFAAGQETAELTLELLDDSESEYDETFLIAVLDADGYVIKSAQLVCGIADDEPAPTVEVSFDCDEELELNDGSGEAELVFKRTGNLATSTLVALYRNDEPMGWVDFAPWQEKQTAWVIEAGVYTMTDADGVSIDGAVVVEDNRIASLNVQVEGADPVLDAVPDSYNPLPAIIQAADSSWLPDWAKGGSYENASEIVVMGSATNNNIYKYNYTQKLGKITFFSGDANYHDLNTSGTGSGIQIGSANIITKQGYDMTGIESVTTYIKTSGVDAMGADMIFTLCTPYTTVTKRVKDDSYYTFTVNTKDKDHSVSKFTFQNYDYTNFSRGCHAYVPNGLKMNKRTYCFQVDNSAATPLHYTGSTAVNGVLPTIDGNDSLINVTMGNTDENRVNLVYSYESYPAVLTGFKLYNPETNVYSDVISLSTGNSGSYKGGTQSASSFLFTREFLKKYEDTYCWLGTVDGVKRHMFTIIPVYEKMPVNYTIEDSVGGKIKLENSSLYRGDIAVFSDDGTSDATLSGVWYTAQSDLSGVTKSGTVDADSDGKVRIMMSAEYSKYTFEGVYDSRADQLLVYMGNNQSQYGSLNFAEGVVLEGDNYVKDEYYPLMATPNDGYIAKWISGGREYYGNTFYYKLDGNSTHNMIVLEFVDSADLVTVDLTGVLSISDVDLRTKYASSLRMAFTKFFITSDTTYNTVTDAKGEFCIENFKGVPGKTYSMMVSYDGAIGYATFVFDESGICNITMPQFSTGMAFPDSVSVTLDGTSGTSNMIQLRNESNITVSVRVYAPADSVEVKEVYFHFMSNPILKSDGTYGSTEKLVLEAYDDNTAPDDENYSYWSVTVPATTLTGNTNLYISVVSDATVFVEGENGMTTSVMTVNSGKVNGGYAFISPITDTSIPVHYDVPATPSIQDAGSIDLKDLGIPLVGNLDISLSSLTGGFFVQRTDPNTGDVILVCGHSFTTTYGTGSIGSKFDAAKKTHNAIMNSAANTPPAGSSDVNVTAANNKNGAPSSWTFSPVFMLKMVVSPDTNGGPGFITAYEMALGIDSFYFRNIPFNVSGVPLYIALSFTLEAYMGWALSIDPGAVNDMGELIELFGKLAIRDDTAEAQTEDQMFFAAPVFKFGAKGGAGYNSFLSLFVELIVSAPFIIQAHPEWDAAVNLGFNINAGADLLVFTGKLPLVQEGVYLGNDELINDLKAITPQTVASASLKSTAANEATLPDMNELFNSITFSPTQRIGNLLRASADAGTVASDAFKNTQVQLVKLEDGTIMAFFLQDTREQDTMNYLSVAYAISNDGGNTWGDIRYIDDQTNNDASSLQYDINIFELNDRLLVTWSEADLDKMISDMNLDVENLTASQVGKLMAAMNLKGVFLNKANGTVISEPFLIARNSTVACGALDAVQNGDMVYIYYQRNAVPENDEMTLMELVSLERTIAMARVNVNSPDECISTPVRAMGEEGQQYRITAVEPFVHDGVMGEVLVLDRDGKIASYNASADSWTSSVEDRQLYLRTYDFDAETGEPIPTALMAITSASVCAQSPQIVSNDKYLHLFWNQNGEVVYITDFVATDSDITAVRDNAYLVRNSDGDVTVNRPVNGYYANDLVFSDKMHAGTVFTASMADDGNVLLSWIAEEPDSQNLIPTDEIYGVLLNTVSNADAVRQSDMTGYELSEENEHIYQLNAVGNPVALTDENGLIGALDSLCLESGNRDKFLLAFTKLNSEMRSTTTAVDIMAVHSENVPALEIVDVSAPTYPIPGSDMTVYVTVANTGIETAANVVVNASNIGSGATATLDELLPGCSETLVLTVAVPESFNETADLNIEADCSNGNEPQYSSVEVKYGAHFVPVDVPVMTASFNSTDCLTETTVKNIGNASGTPTITFINTIFGSDMEGKEYTFASDVNIIPGGETTVTYLLEDTLINEEKTAYMTVSLGEEYDQSVQSFMPALVNNSINGNADGSVTSTVSGIVEAVNAYDNDTVTSNDKADIEKLVEDMDTLLGSDDLSEEDEQLLNDAKAKAEALLDTIRKAAEAIQTENIEKVKDITAENAEPKHKSDLEKAKSDLEKALELYGGNYTEEEKRAIESDTRRINGALEAIDMSSENETPNTGDNSKIFLWVALLFGSGSAIIALNSKRKKIKSST
ncbi:MAG: hypothetical protein E7597_05710 [Ruminococcaceae bacterium]|nr:hypothetical protein [Oscillospiraceae bacterium]